MTEPQEFCLRWNNHQATIISVFDYLLENETLVDCTLAAEGQYLKAHKVVLCACSPYLEILLSQHNDKHPILIFKDIKYHELKCMIEYMYKGEVNIAQDQLNHFLKAAESLQIKGLSESEEEPAPQTAVPTPRPPPPRAPPVQRTQPRPFSNAVAVRSTGPSEDDVSKRLIGRTEAQSPTPRKRRRQAPLAVQGRSSISGDDASNASEGHFDQSNCDVPTPSHPTPSDSSKAVAKVESSSELMLEPKTEYDDNDNSVEDITLDDDDEDYSQAGTSQMDNSQGNFGAWQQMVGDQTGDEVFSGQESGVQNSQENNVTLAVNEDLELGKSVDVKTSPCKPKSPANNSVNFNKNDNQINYMRFWLNSERMVSTPVIKEPDLKDKVNRQVKSGEKSKPTLKVGQKKRKRKTFAPVKKSKTNSSYQEKFENGIKKEKTQTNSSTTARENLTDSAKVKRKYIKKTADSASAKGKAKNTVIKQKRRFKHVPEDAEILGIPLLKYGWRREIVYRQGKALHADVYYRSPPPFNKKFRSKVEIGDALLAKEYREQFPSLTDSCFSFSRVSLGLGEPYELERNAKGRSKDSKQILKTEAVVQEVHKSEPIEVQPLQSLEEYERTPDYTLTHEQWIGNLVY